MGEIEIGSIKEIIRKYGIDTSFICKNENINGINFPVTYFKDGTIIVDYPNPPLR